MRLIKVGTTEAKTTTQPSKRPTLSVVKSKTGGRARLSREKAVAEAVKRTG